MVGLQKIAEPLFEYLARRAIKNIPGNKTGANNKRLDDNRGLIMPHQLQLSISSWPSLQFAIQL